MVWIERNEKTQDGEESTREGRVGVTTICKSLEDIRAWESAALNGDHFAAEGPLHPIPKASLDIDSILIMIMRPSISGPRSRT